MTLRIVENTPTIGTLSAKEIILDLYENRDNIKFIQGAFAYIDEDGHEVAVTFSNDMDVGTTLHLQKIVELENNMAMIEQTFVPLDSTDPEAS